MQTCTTPPTPDRDSIAWWNALQNGVLMIQQCHDCGRRRWPLRDVCAACGGTIAKLVPTRGAATVATWTTVRRSPDPRVPVPYVVLLARLDDDPDILMPGWYDGPQDGTGLSIGMAVEAEIYGAPVGNAGEKQNLIRWRTPTQRDEERR